jgi:hypothetical protein
MSDLDELRRWVDFGGTWEVVARQGDLRVIALLQCDGGEEASRLVSNEPELRSYVDARA